jgi:uncharacterized protein (DUF2267 family)
MTTQAQIPRTGRQVLDPTIALAADWIDEIARRTDCPADIAFAVLRAGLHALRDRLPEDEACAVAQDLPALIRGVWFEGWAPRAPVRDPTLGEWLVTLEGHLLAGNADAVPARKAAPAVFAVLKGHLGHDRTRRLAEELPRDMAGVLYAA